MKLSSVEGLDGIYEVKDYGSGKKLTGADLKKWLERQHFRIEGDEVGYTRRDRDTGAKTHVREEAKIKRRIAKALVAQKFKAVLDQTGGHWTTLETLFNAQKYVQTNQALHLGLYTLPLNFVDVNIVENPPDHLKEILPCFFPNVPLDEVLAWARERYSESQENVASVHYGSLTGGGKRASISLASSSGRNVLVASAPHKVVMPFDYLSNSNGTLAIGVKLVSEVGMNRLQAEWKLWRTASRSKLVEVSPTDPAQRAEPNGWTFGREDKKEIEGSDKYDLATLRRELASAQQSKAQVQQEIADKTISPMFAPRRMSLADKGIKDIEDKIASLSAGSYDGNGLEGGHFAGDPARCVSIKTGVQYIGVNYQGSRGSTGKDNLEANNHFARLRTDHVLAEDRKLKPDEEFAMLHELFSVTIKEGIAEKLNIRNGDGKVIRDGYSVRDVSELKPDMLYMPALCLPYAGYGFLKVFRKQHPGEEWSFDQFWGVHYAERLGRVKAKFLLRYGLQMVTPNPQNMLIECTGRFEPKRIVLRDIGDANLHFQMVRALYPNTVQDGRTAFPEHPQLDSEYDSRDAYKKNLGLTPFDTETGKEPADALTLKYPPGTLFQWHGYSTFKGQYLDEIGQLFCTDSLMIRWGCLHDDAYVAYLKEALPGLKLADHYRHEEVQTAKEAEKAERQRAADLHSELVRHLNTAPGMDELATYRKKIAR